MISDMPPVSERFPRAAKYNPDWVLATVSGAANPLWLSEWLAAAMDLRPGMRVLDLACGRAASPIFLRREFGGRFGHEDGVFPPCGWQSSVTLRE
jgi:hypothetical protein